MSQTLIRQAVDLTPFDDETPSISARIPDASQILLTDQLLLWQTPNAPDTFRPRPYLSLVPVVSVSAQEGWIRNVDTNLVHQVLMRANSDGDSEMYISDGVSPSSLRLKQSDGVQYWAKIGSDYYSLLARNNPDGVPEYYLSAASACPDLFIQLYNPDDSKTYKLRARNNIDGDPEPYLSLV